MNTSLVYCSKKSNIDYEKIYYSKGIYSVEIMRARPDDASPEEYLITVAEMIDILSRCFPEGVGAPSKRVVDVVYRSFYRDDTALDPSIPSSIDDPFFDADSYSINPVPSHPDYDVPEIVIGWDAWYSETAYKWYCSDITSIELNTRKDGKICFGFGTVDFEVNADEMRSLIHILKAIDERFSVRSE